MAASLICYLTYYCQDHIEKSQKIYYIFALPFIRKGDDVLRPLRALDTYLNGFHFSNPLSERVPADRERQPLNLKIWARMTAKVLNFSHNPTSTPEIKQAIDTAVAHIFCHWNCLIHTVTDIAAIKGHEEEKRTQDLADLCAIFANEFSDWILDGRSELLAQSKHAVFPFLKFQNS
jgi:hypothetical protein